jgi:dTDP-4-amino-4,6-dideoxygalactose transaminase
MRLHGIAGDAWKRYGKNGSWSYEVVEAGFKYNPTDLQAALGIVQLAKCDASTSARSRIADRYTEEFQHLPGLETPQIKSDRESSWHLYILRLHLDQLRVDRDAFVDELKERGIGTSVHFTPLHLHPFYRRCYGYKPGDFPVAEAQFERCISLPIYPRMDEENVQHVIDTIADIVSRDRR